MDDPAILYTTAIGMVIGAFAFLRTLATERQGRVELIRSMLEAERNQQQQQQQSPQE
jgi:hypothetical protein